MHLWMVRTLASVELHNRVAMATGAWPRYWQVAEAASGSTGDTKWAPP